VPTDSGEVMNTGLVITPAWLEVPAAQANAAHEAVKELMGTALAKAREAGQQDKAHHVPLEAAGRIAAESSRPRCYSLKRVALGPSISMSMRAFSTAFPIGSLLK